MATKRLGITSFKSRPLGRRRWGNGWVVIFRPRRARNWPRARLLFFATRIMPLCPTRNSSPLSLQWSETCVNCTCTRQAGTFQIGYARQLGKISKKRDKRSEAVAGLSIATDQLPIFSPATACSQHPVNCTSPCPSDSNNNNNMTDSLHDGVTEMQAAS